MKDEAPRSIDLMRFATFRVVQDIREAGYLPGHRIVLTLADEPGGRRIGPESLAVLRWIGEGRLEEEPIPGPGARVCR